ncbi:AcvB/VirJ family lysyl-phosphatidylglycerol hydrolase [Kaistella palustris]|uniref:AcvB/VirJ family lysyl-phosphatidylglycerol hydrolase n=1 Tax=Kaistella palustris TaxID=493376 RepID=UPI0004217272|nr:AcvB/VirJ family lysyl-phosphatidylglycerol hydrolase [Kaistella palustris]
MKKFAQFLGVSSLLILISCKTSDPFPVSSWNGNSTKPVIFYVSGDGGFNTFSKSLSQELHRFGYDVFALNSKKYFWKKRTPAGASADTEIFLKELIKNRKNKKIILIGYSYGADVVPFIYNRFDPDFQKNISSLIIVGPSKVNDFEIHLQEYVTGEKEYGFSVISEINRLKGVPVTVVVSDFEKLHFPMQEITLKKYNFLHLAGNHQYNGNTKMLADALVKYF